MAGSKDLRRSLHVGVTGLVPGETVQSPGGELPHEGVPHRDPRRVHALRQHRLRALDDLILLETQDLIH